MRTRREPTPFDDVQALTGRRVHLPFPLVYSRAHSHSAVMAYGLIDVMTGEDWGPFESRVDWIARRLDISDSCVSKAIGMLSRPHAGKTALDPDLPAYLGGKQRGHGRSALRWTVETGDAPIEVPEWTLGDAIRGPVVSAQLWRLYAILLHKRMPGLGTVALKTAELARYAHVRPATLPSMIRALEDARLVVRLERSGSTTVLLPVTVRITEAQRDELLGRLATEFGVESGGQADESCGQPGDNSADNCGEPCGEAPAPPASPCKAPPASPCKAPPASPCEAIEGDPDYEDPIYEVPVVGGAAPSERTPDEKPLRVVASRSPLAAGGSLTVTATGSAADWCGRCPGPSRRVETHPETGHPTGKPCPRCGPKVSPHSARAA